MGKSVKEGIMPRETVPRSTPALDTFEVQVGWSRDQDAQLGISSTEHRHLVDVLYGGGNEPKVWRLLKEKLADTGRVLTDDNVDLSNPAHNVELTDQMLGRMILDAVTGSSSLGGPGIWTSLSRQEINDLIVLLRKARDSAYGRDQ